MSQNIYMLLAIFTACAATFLTRVLPFLLFDKKQKPSPFLDFLHKNMPLMIMVILVFYAIKDTAFLEYPYGIPELIGVLSVFILHIKFKNALLSIISSTVIYMILVQMAF
ncbi:MAG: AzlD domain-containing protein [Campylobacteraceae bacterium]|jgi:branched-subunit amino acid transport protein AzlD|nr:AzlD domain-containing protein [Campylobacteraceae bacterium]